jgi:hypothetical protein
MTALNIYAQELPAGLLDRLARFERRQQQDEGRRAGDHDDGGPSIDWTWRHLGALTAAGLFLFTLGMNWHRIDALTDTVSTQAQRNAEDHATFARQQAIDQHFDSLQRQIEDLKTYLVRDRARTR